MGNVVERVASQARPPDSPVCIGVQLLLWVAMHFMLTTINPAQESPAGHSGTRAGLVTWLSSQSRSSS